MFCIAAFIVFAVLGIFSARYRSLAKKAWYCVGRRVTFKPCDINFNEEMRDKLVGSLIFRAPRLARFVDRWINALSFIFVVLSIWSLLVVLNSGLNLLVYDTCNPSNAESCSLGGEACGIVRGRLTFWESVKEGKVLNWAGTGIKDFGITVSRIPDRMRDWDPADFVTADSTYYEPFDAAKPTALEIIDPGCIFCARMLQNIKTAGFEKRYNLTYIAYPIPDHTQDNGYKFPNSHLVASYLEVLKTNAPEKARLERPADWLLLEKIFSGNTPEGETWQSILNRRDLRPEEPKAILAHLLSELGYSAVEIAGIDSMAASDEIKQKMEANKRIVENDIRTIKIPTIMFDGRRHDRLLPPDKLD